MHVEREIHNKLIFKFILGVKRSIKEKLQVGERGFNMLFKNREKFPKDVMALMEIEVEQEEEEAVGEEFDK